MRLKEKTAIISFRATPKERQAIKVMARQEGLRFSEMLRVLVREGAERRGIGPIAFVGNQITQEAQDDR